MDRSEVYELACERWESPAVVQWGDRHIIGRWVKIAQDVGGLILQTRHGQAVEVLGEGASWCEAAKAAGLVKP